jgi:hypothetical protein
MTASAHVTARLDAIHGTLSVARGLVRARRQIDLRGLEQDVGQICAACLDLPPEQGRAMRPRLQALLAELDALGTDFAADAAARR